jgi:hypothetical protein
MEVTMKMRIKLVCMASLAAAALPAISPAYAQAVAESKLPHSSASVLVDPGLNDGRLVLRVAVKNLSGSPVPFGPANVTITKPNGQTIAITPLSSLIDDVRMAAGMSVAPDRAAPTQGAYAAPQQGVRDGRVDVSGYTGGSTVGSGEYIRQSRSRKVKPTISESEAERQIATLSQAILKDSTLASGQIGAGQIVTEKLPLGKKEDRTLHLRIGVADDEHGFTIEAPKD